jgi:hypothetical protein
VWHLRGPVDYVPRAICYRYSYCHLSSDPPSSRNRFEHHADDGRPFHFFAFFRAPFATPTQDADSYACKTLGSCSTIPCGHFSVLISGNGSVQPPQKNIYTCDVLGPISVRTRFSGAVNAIRTLLTRAAA